MTTRAGFHLISPSPHTRGELFPEAIVANARLSAIDAPSSDSRSGPYRTNVDGTFLHGIGAQFHALNATTHRPTTLSHTSTQEIFQAATGHGYLGNNGAQTGPEDRPLHHSDMPSLGSTPGDAFHPPMIDDNLLICIGAQFDSVSSSANHYPYPATLVLGPANDSCSYDGPSTLPGSIQLGRFVASPGDRDRHDVDNDMILDMNVPLRGDVDDGVFQAPWGW
ncbi:hypothetical protein MKZ38_006777 [Zalerion maritima]|uniref:Uncharacterized protein n=1 Tax=Zalerion maritima TaxID=339359 RepID=A0AAD5WQ53_9PEZI|nr:hypothetical protein MKZ38_006777 [Zalerion maritima]